MLDLDAIDNAWHEKYREGPLYTGDFVEAAREAYDAIPAMTRRIRDQDAEIARLRAENEHTANRSRKWERCAEGQRAANDQLRGILADTIELAEGAMRDANHDCGEYDIDECLSAARAASKGEL